MRKMLEKLSFGISIKSFWLILGLSVYFGTVLNLSFWRFAYYHIEVTDFRMVVFAVSLFFFMTVPFFILFNLIIVPYVGKFLTVFFLLVSSATNYLMVNLGVYIDTDMVRNAFETNAREAFDLITLPGMMWVLVTGILPAIFVMKAKIKYASAGREILKRMAGIVVSLMIIGGFALTSYKEYAAFGRNK